MALSIRIENLGKEYAIGSPTDNLLTFREALTAAVKSPLRRYRRLKVDSTETEKVWALKNIDLEIQQGEVLGVIGRNGAGKSTLLKVLSRITAPTTGRIEIRGRLGCLLEVATGFHPELTGRENIFLNGAILGMSKKEVRGRFDEIVSFAGVETFLDTPVKRYSSGMYVRLAFAVAAHTDPDVLLVDEVLAVGDLEFQKKCLGAMENISRGGRTVLFVSHNMDSIRRLCNTAILLDGGEIKKQGEVASVVDSYYKRFDSSASKILQYEPKPKDEYYISRIEILDASRRAKQDLKTWDSVVFRFVIFASSEWRGASVVFWVNARNGTRIVLTSTQPDHDFCVDLKRGETMIDLEFPCLLLSAGRYAVGAGLAIPNVEMVFRRSEFGVIEVLPNDVYRSGLPPLSSRYLLPMPHSWNQVK